MSEAAAKDVLKIVGVSSVDEVAVATWPEIHRRFFHFDMNGELEPYCSLRTLQEKYGPELMECGAVVKFHKGRSRHPIMLGWPSRILAYIQWKQVRGEF